MNDPTVLLRNEHAALLGRLDLLEQSKKVKGEELIDLLRTLERDSSVHFQRENLLIEELISKLGSGGHQLKSLTTEHESFCQEIKNLLEMLTPLNDYPPYRVGPGIKKKLQEFTEQFKAHIRHEELVVFLLAKSRLTPTQLRTISHKMLAL